MVHTGVTFAFLEVMITDTLLIVMAEVRNSKFQVNNYYDTITIIYTGMLTLQF